MLLTNPFLLLHHAIVHCYCRSSERVMLLNDPATLGPWVMKVNPRLFGNNTKITDLSSHICLLAEAQVPFSDSMEKILF